MGTINAPPKYYIHRTKGIIVKGEIPLLPDSLEAKK
jgi:hypothetical protein